MNIQSLKSISGETFIKIRDHNDFSSEGDSIDYKLNLNPLLSNTPIPL